jgi:Tfp pilus assembly pilus retraction ATPase PilT
MQSSLTAEVNNIAKMEPMVSLSASPDMKEIENKILIPFHGQVSDFFFICGWPICVRHNGVIKQLSEKNVSKDIVDHFLEKMLNNDKVGDIKKGSPDSWSHKITVNNVSKPKRLRCAASTGQTSHGMNDVDIVQRPISDTPLELDTLGFPQHFKDACFPSDGLVLFSGPTGSGKTTLLAAILQEIARWPGGQVLCTLEDPIEYNLHGITGRTGIITQAERGRNFDSFVKAMEHLLRKNPD